MFPVLSRRFDVSTRKTEIHPENGNIVLIIKYVLTQKPFYKQKQHKYSNSKVCFENLNFSNVKSRFS